MTAFLKQANLFKDDKKQRQQLQKSVSKSRKKIEDLIHERQARVRKMRTVVPDCCPEIHIPERSTSRKGIKPDDNSGLHPMNNGERRLSVSSTHSANNISAALTDPSTSSVSINNNNVVSTSTTAGTTTGIVNSNKDNNNNNNNSDVHVDAAMRQGAQIDLLSENILSTPSKASSSTKGGIRGNFFRAGNRSNTGNTTTVDNSPHTNNTAYYNNNGQWSDQHASDYDDMDGYGGQESDADRLSSSDTNTGMRRASNNISVRVLAELLEQKTRQQKADAREIMQQLQRLRTGLETDNNQMQLNQKTILENTSDVHARFDAIEASFNNVHQQLEMQEEKMEDVIQTLIPILRTITEMHHNVREVSDSITQHVETLAIIQHHETRLKSMEESVREQNDSEGKKLVVNASTYILTTLSIVVLWLNTGRVYLSNVLGARQFTILSAVAVLSLLYKLLF